MTSQIQKFVFPLTNQETRIVDRDGNPWWVLRDVCEVLSIGNSRMVADRLDDDEKGVSQIDTPGGLQNLTIINEAGLYSVILRSDKPEAKAFRRWVTHEVLPQIRKTGAYNAATFDLDNPEHVMAALVAQNRKALELQAEVNELKPKADAMRRLEGADGSMCITNAAKALSVRPKDLFSHLQANKWIYKRPGTSVWIGYQDKIQAGLIEMSEYLQTKEDGTEVVRVRAKITAKGLVKLASAFEAVSSN